MSVAVLKPARFPDLPEGLFKVLRIVARLKLVRRLANAVGALFVGGVSRRAIL
jgi:hypothetical protein